MTNEEQKQGQCPFCAIAQDKLPTVKIYEDQNIMAVLDIRPATKGHIVVFPKQHYPFLYAMPNEVAGQMFVVAKSLSSVAVQAFGAQGINIIHSMGAIAGQRAGHVILNLIPRYANDGVTIDWKNKEVPQEELAESFKVIMGMMQKNTMETLKAIKEGKIKVPEDVKKQAEAILAKSAEKPKQEKKEKSTKPVGSLDDI